MLKCSRCGSIKMATSRSGPHIAAHCAECGFFVKFLTKEEARVLRGCEDRMISEAVLLSKLREWNLGKELPTWVVRAVKDTPDARR